MMAMARLERLRGLILRGITDASKSSPITALGALMGLEPLHLTITAEAGKAVRRIGESSNIVISKKLKTTVNIAKRPIMKMVRDRTSPRYLFDKKYKVSLSTMEDWKAGRAHLPGDRDNWFANIIFRIKIKHKPQHSPTTVGHHIDIPPILVSSFHFYDILIKSLILLFVLIIEIDSKMIKMRMQIH